MIVTIVLVIVVILIVTSLTLLYMKRGSQSTKMYSLSDSLTKVSELTSLPWNMKTPSSLRFAVYIQTAPKTISNVNCVNATNTNTLTQSCNDYMFTTCTCNSANDCNNCKTDSYLSSLLSLGKYVNLLVSGYVSHTDKPLVSTLLTIQTASSSSTHIESISLPAIPLQKWTVITLVQEGRRIDVYFGANLVATTYLKYTPVPAAGSEWTVGGMNGWSGHIGLFSKTLSPRSSNDVSNDVAELVDTTGLPYSLQNIDFSFDFSLPSCIFGTCHALPSIRPPNPFSVYASSVQ